MPASLPPCSCCTACWCNARRLVSLLTPEWVLVCTSAPKLTSRPRWHRLFSARHSKSTATPAKAGKLNDRLQAAIFFWGGAQRRAHSRSSQRVSAWHACMDRGRITPSLYAWSPHRQQPLGKGAQTHPFTCFHAHATHTCTCMHTSFHS